MAITYKLDKGGGIFGIRNLLRQQLYREKISGSIIGNPVLATIVLVEILKQEHWISDYGIKLI